MTELLENKPAAHLELEDGYRLRVSFAGKHPSLITDLAPPLGDGVGPKPEDLLAASVGSCLASSLLFCARKARLGVQGLEVDVRMAEERREGRLRIARIEVDLMPRILAADRSRVGFCLERFESYCTVTESVRRGIPVQVFVRPVVAAAETSQLPAA
jgi:uncharacterized OsmC-like protein